MLDAVEKDNVMSWEQKGPGSFRLASNLRGLGPDKVERQDGRCVKHEEDSSVNGKELLEAIALSLIYTGESAFNPSAPPRQPNPLTDNGIATLPADLS